MSIDRSTSGTDSVVNTGPVAQVLVPADMAGLAHVRRLVNQLVMKESDAFSSR